MRLLLTSSNSSDVARGIERLSLAAYNERLDLHSAIVLHRGQVQAEAFRPPFDAKTPHRMYSVTKSFTSSAIGLAFAEKRLGLDDRLVELFPDHVPIIADVHLQELRVRHLLTMTAEHGRSNASGRGRIPFTVADFLAQKLARTPGVRFDYSNACSYMLAAVVQRVTGQTLHSYLRSRLFEPLDIDAEHWIQSDEGVSNGAWGLHLTSGELARFGQLYLQRGVWKGCQVLPATWIDEATSKKVESWGNSGATDWSLGYGYQFWRGRDDSYRADGLLGQFCLVLPKLEMVVVVTAGTLRTQRVLDLIWEHIVFSKAQQQSSLVAPAAPDATPANFSTDIVGALKGVSFDLQDPFPLPSRMFDGPIPVISVAPELEGDEPCVVISDTNAAYRIAVGLSKWSGGITPVSTRFPEPYEARLTFPGADRALVVLVFIEAGFELVFDFNVRTMLLTITTPANPGWENSFVIGRPA